MKIYSPSVLKARILQLVSLGQNQIVGRAVFPPGVLGETPFLFSSCFWGLPLSLACGHIIQSLLLCSHCLFLFHLSIIPFSWYSIRYYRLWFFEENMCYKTCTKPVYLEFKCMVLFSLCIFSIIGSRTAEDQKAVCTAGSWNTRAHLLPLDWVLAVSSGWGCEKTPARLQLWQDQAPLLCNVLSFISLFTNHRKIAPSLKKKSYNCYQGSFKYFVFY